MTGENEKRVQITSNFTSEAEVFYERIEDKKTGEVDYKQNSKPSTVTSKTTITTRPYKYETEIQPKPKEATEPAVKIAKIKPGYDASEL